MSVDPLAPDSLLFVHGNHMVLDGNTMAQRVDPNQQNILRISDADTLKLVIRYGEEPSLWMTNHKDYKNRIVRRAAAERIAKYLDIPNFEAKHVMIKFKNLRNGYCQELKKIAACIEAGKTGDEVYKPKLFWFRHMDEYLRPYLQPTKTTRIMEHHAEKLGSPFPTCKTIQENPVSTCRTIQVKEESNQSDSSHPDWVSVSPSNPEQEFFEETTINPFPSSEDEWPSPLEQRCKRPRRDSRSSHTALESGLSSGPRKPTVPDDSKALDSLLASGFLKTIAGNLERLTRQKDDHFESFGRYVASVLRSMPTQQAIALQPKIVSLITTGLVDEGAVSQSDNL